MEEPEYCNLDRLWYAMERRGLDGLVLTQPLNVFYLSRFNGIAHKSDEPRPYALILSRHVADHPILILAEYYLGSFVRMETWIRDIRPFRAVMMPMDLPSRCADVDVFLSHEALKEPWVHNARKNYRFDMKSVLMDALVTLNLSNARIGFDDLAFAYRLRFDDITPLDAYDCLMYARAVKTSNEIALLEKATHLNEAAIHKTRADWFPGMTWRELDLQYSVHVAALGGFVRDPGGLVWGHPHGDDTALMLNARNDNTPIQPGTHVMFDCHGTLDLYCWDGGKTWVVDGEPEGLGKQLDKATQEVAPILISAMKPGVRIRELQAFGRSIYHKCGVSDSEKAIIFFHGLGLSHMDLELQDADGKANIDWVLEEGMVVPAHLLYPGGERERLWLEEVVVIEKDGGRPLFTWGFDTLVG